MTISKNWVTDLVTWYQTNKRDLPWRKTQDPYAIWISEIMLQQTRVEAVIGYYQRFMQRFTKVEELAGAEIDEVLKLWEGLGYYSRAKNLHKAAKEIVAKGKGFPQTHQEVLALAGIGRYTAGAIMSIAFNLPYPAVDGNVLRVITRLFLLDKDITSSRVKTEIEELLKEVFPKEASDFTQGLMELGALICLPTSPRCGQCPIGVVCKARQENKQNELPVKKPKAEPQQVKRYLAIIQSNGAVLMNKRPEGGLLGGLWEFPGVTVNNKQDFVGAFEQEFGLAIAIQQHLLDTRHIFSHRIWEMKVYQCQIVTMEQLKKTTLRWIPLDQLDGIAIPGAFQRIKDALQNK